MERHLWIWRGEKGSDERADHVLKFLYGFAAIVAPYFIAILEKDISRIVLNLIFRHEIFACCAVDLKNVCFIADTFAEFIDNVVHGSAAFLLRIVEFHECGFGFA